MPSVVCSASSAAKCSTVQYKCRFDGGGGGGLVMSCLVLSSRLFFSLVLSSLVSLLFSRFQSGLSLVYFLSRSNRSHSFCQSICSAPHRTAPTTRPTTLYIPPPNSTQPGSKSFGPFTTQRFAASVQYFCRDIRFHLVLNQRSSTWPLLDQMTISS